ncbi:hypothetical protein [Pseudotabrizicola alkalilacus]|nr:hypothetical protein [Pseudotabrizicola alkalilacus]
MDLAQSLNSAEINGIILHIGAGQGAQLDSWLATRAKQIYLVEPNSQLAENLTRRAGSEPRLTVLAAAVAENSGTVPLNIFNFAELSSIREPGDILKLFPGLRVSARPMVAAVTMNDLLAQLPPPSADDDLLVIEAPGAEGIVLKGLADLDGLRRFSRIILHCGTDALYQGAPGAAELSRDLIAQGYAQVPLTTDDPDFVTSLFTFDRAAFAQKETQARLQAAEGQAAALQRQLGELGVEVALKNNLLEQMQTALAEMTASAQAQGDYSRKLETQVAEHVASRKEIDAKVEWRGNRIKELGAELEGMRTTMAAAAAQQSARIAALETDLAARDVALTSAADATEQLATRAIALQAELDSLRAETTAVSARQTARIAELEAELSLREAALVSGAHAAEQETARATSLAAELESLRDDMAAAADQQAARIATLEADLAEREAALAAGAHAAEQETARATSLAAELESLRDDMAAAADQQAARIATLQADLAEREAALAAGATSADQQAGRIATLEADLAARDTALAAGTEAAEQQAARIAALKTELEASLPRARHNEHVEALKKAIAERDASLNSLRSEMAAAAETQARRIATLEADLAGQQAALAKGESAAEELEVQIATLEADLAGQQAALAKSESAAEELEVQIVRLEADLAEKQAALAKSESAAEEREAQIATLEADLAGRDEALANAATTAEQQAARIAALKTELDASLPRARHNEHVEALKKSIADRDANLSNLRTQMAAAAETQAKRIATLEADLAEQQAALAGGESAAEEQAERISRLEADLVSRDDALTKHSEDATQQAERITTLEAELAASIPAETHSQQLEKLKASLAEQAAEMKAGHQQETTLSLRMLALRDADLADLRSRYARLQSDKEEQDQLLQDLTVRLTEASYYLQELERDAPASLMPIAQASVSKSAASKATVGKASTRESGHKAKKRSK